MPIPWSYNFTRRIKMQRQKLPQFTVYKLQNDKDTAKLRPFAFRFRNSIKTTIYNTREVLKNARTKRWAHLWEKKLHRPKRPVLATSRGSHNCCAAVFNFTYLVLFHTQFIRKLHALKPIDLQISNADTTLFEQQFLCYACCNASVSNFSSSLRMNRLFFMLSKNPSFTFIDLFRILLRQWFMIIYR